MENSNSPETTNGHDWGNGTTDQGTSHGGAHEEHLNHAEQAEWEHSHGEGRHGHQASLGDALDFINTLSFDKGDSTEGLTDVPTTVHWLQGHELLHREMVTDLIDRYEREDPQPVLQRVRKVRGALRELLDATVERRRPHSSALREVNRALRAPYLIELVPAKDGVSLDHRHEGDPLAGAMARLSEAVARELTQGDPKRMRVCANDECRWVFRDYSPAGRRKWCDMSTCGNRAKAARHRERQKAKEKDEETADQPALLS
jgi:predicted RNA-binding Zn ribbon-like protein